MRLAQFNRRGPKEAVPFVPGSPAYEASVERARTYWIEERRKMGLSTEDTLRVKVQTYRTEKFA
jgi:hypothetical protein